MSFRPPSTHSPAPPADVRRRPVGFLRSLVWAVRTRQAVWVRRRLAARATAWPHPIGRSTLVVAPHPDDETFGCGGLIALKRAAGATVVVAFLTDGRRGDRFDGTAAAGDLVQIRRAEAVEALARLGVDEADLHFAGADDGTLNALPLKEQGRIRALLSDLIVRHNVQEVFVTHRADGHRDHEASYLLVRSILEGLSAPSALYEYMVWAPWVRPASMLVLGRTGKVFALRVHSVGRLKQNAIEKYASQLASLPVGFCSQAYLPVEIFWGTP